MYGGSTVAICKVSIVRQLFETSILFFFSRVVVQANAAASNVSMKKKVSSSDVNTKIYAGDIFLKFKHSPSLAGKGRIKSCFAFSFFLCYHSF